MLQLINQQSISYLRMMSRSISGQQWKFPLSGPSLALYLTKKDAIQGFHALLGPAEKNKIKEATGTFRHDFDIVDAKINSLHAPRTRAEANRHLQFFFPEERILVILKPNLSDQQRSEIVAAFKKAGFFIMTRKMEKLTSEQVAQLQQSHQGKDYYNELLNYMTSGPSELFVLVKENASQSWQQLVGPDDPAKAVESAPTSLRALYGKDLVHNAIDVSMDVEQAKNDIHLIFGDLDREEVFFFLKSKNIYNSMSISLDAHDKPLQLDIGINEGES
ncbi:unnamed protein product [Rotaria sordida]|uniref:Nucleoside diphosphate kinase-like domain-containing protein n=1 Tax=Rotaria sordida TaxID=392033 RepID=A0A819DP14_9BILA|nr:unnamed protein product [Rotaria sordida]